MFKATSSRRSSRALGRLLTLSVAVVLVSLAAAPAGAQSPPWATYPAGQATASGSATQMVLVGDSNIVIQGISDVAGFVKAVSGGRTSTVNAAVGASWVTYAWPGEQNNNPYLWHLSAYTGARMTIAALGTNDARVLTQYPSSVYNAGAQYTIMNMAVTETRKYSRCVLLVNVKARNVTAMTAASAQVVNTNMANLAASFPGGRVFVADWNAHAQNSWFIPNDVHMTAAGYLHYSAFIGSRIQHHIANNGC